MSLIGLVLTLVVVGVLLWLLRTRAGVIVRAAGSRRPSKRTAPSSAGVRNGLAVIRSRTRNQIATAAAPASPTRIPS